MKVGLALGGGGVRGLAHVLALETLDRRGIRPAALAGTSMGAIIGALYAAGRRGTAIHEMVSEHVPADDEGIGAAIRRKVDLIRWLGAVRPAWGKSGLFRADRFLHDLLETIEVDTFEELEIPLRVVATDFYRGDAVVIDSGELLPALLASMSIPGVFVPVEHEGRFLVDGGVVNNLPYDVLPEDCDATIAIDVAPTRRPGEDEPPNMVEATLGMFDILVESLTAIKLRERPPTLYVRPELVGIPLLDFERIDVVLEQAGPAMRQLDERLGRLQSG
ncbi:MAG: patatin-like phospholipase family protein [Candidatus Eiseniibacteriota bacterium]|jgi:NTE family protein